MATTRKQKLQRNLKLSFWIQALNELKVISVISTLFLVHRGLSLSQVLFTAIIFSATCLLTEIPSSYLADKWGRKKIIILSLVCSLGHWIIFLFASNIFLFIIAFIFCGFSFSLMSGTDEAFVYDTTRELGEERNSLKALGRYFSGRRIFKIITPILAVLIAKDLAENQFIFILMIDIAGTFLAIILSLLIVEPDRFLSVEKIEAGVMKDAFKIIRSNPSITKAIFNRTLIFIASFIIWRISSEFFVNIGVSVILVGVSVSFYQLAIFLSFRHIDKFLPRIAIERRINWLNYLFIISLASTIACLFLFPNKYLILILYTLGVIFETTRGALFSEYYNKQSCSYNRATTLSLANFMKSILDIPLLLLGAYLVTFSVNYIFVLSFVVSLIVIIFFGLSGKKTTRPTSS
ncbi:MAG TPA: MFS transporter [Patescibacteria group bacterium]|nr:MFS transporter [Patescibacteria group bacterium]